MELKLVSASCGAAYLAYQAKYGSIRDRYHGTVEADSELLVVDGQKIALSHARNLAEFPFTAHVAEHVCASTGAFGRWRRSSRIQRLIAMRDPEVELKLVNASCDAEYLTYQLKYGSIHDRCDGTVEADSE